MWSPDINVYNILKEIQTLLGSPDVVNETTITNPEAAKLFQENFEEYKKRVLKCVEESLREDKTSDIQQYQTEDDGTWQVLAQLELSRRRNILTNSWILHYIEREVGSEFSCWTSFSSAVFWDDELRRRRAHRLVVGLTSITQNS